MNPYLKVTGLDTDRLAGLLGFNKQYFAEWAAGQRKFPSSAVRRIAAVVGVSPESLESPPKRTELEDLAPAVWFKLRSNLTDADREVVVLLKELGVYMDDLETVLGESSGVRWRLLGDEVLRGVDPEDPPREQGRQAAKVFRDATSLEYGQGGVGEVMRPVLRNFGLLFVEAPLPGSRVEGCTFRVGPTKRVRPCVFVNTATTTWFRRNYLLFHEVAHALFDLQNGASLDFLDDSEAARSLEEERANAFAQEVTVPWQVLRSAASRCGVRWDSLDADQLARLVAEIHVEPGLVLRAASEAGLVDESVAVELRQVRIWNRLKELTDHALTAEEYVKRYPEKAEGFAGKRSTTARSVDLRLPVGYVKRVVDAEKAGKISAGRAARMLMITSDDFLDRFEEAATLLP